MQIKNFFNRIGKHRVVFKKDFSVFVSDRFKDYSVETDKNNPCISLLFELASEGKIFFDIGAHVGLYTIPAALLVGKSGFVHSFDSSSHAIEALNKHLTLNGIVNCRVNTAYVGDQNGVQKIFDGVLEVSDRGGVLKPKSCNQELFREKVVTSITLDNYCEEHSTYPDILKIDVEGAELKVLKGAEKIIKAYQPVIFLSVHPEKILELGEQPEDIFEFAAHTGYVIKDTAGSAIKTLALSEYVLWPESGN